MHIMSRDVTSLTIDRCHWCNWIVGGRPHIQRLYLTSLLYCHPPRPRRQLPQLAVINISLSVQRRVDDDIEPNVAFLVAQLTSLSVSRVSYWPALAPAMICFSRVSCDVCYTTATVRANGYSRRWRKTTTSNMRCIRVQNMVGITAAWL